MKKVTRFLIPIVQSGNAWEGMGSHAEHGSQSELVPV